MNHVELFAPYIYRACEPDETLRFLEPKLPGFGITRIADVTRLDRIGIPTCCAIRPAAHVMQVTNGKGLSKSAAQVSAVMESIELFHAEDGTEYPALHASERVLRKQSAVVQHESLASYQQIDAITEYVDLNWIEVEDVVTGRNAWVPKSAVFFDEHLRSHSPTTNGLASGNALDEATLHALYEIVERDAGSRLFEGGRLDLARRGAVIDPDSVDVSPLNDLIARIKEHSDIVICSVTSVVDVYTFWVVLLNKTSLSALTTLNIGWGTHGVREIALSRALTEAAQSRLTHIHGAREDIVVQAGYHTSNVRNSAAYRFFSNLDCNLRWHDIPVLKRQPGKSVKAELDSLFNELASAGFNQIFRYDLTREKLDVPVVKLLIPGMLFNQKLF